MQNVGASPEYVFQIPRVWMKLSEQMTAVSAGHGHGHGQGHGHGRGDGRLMTHSTAIGDPPSGTQSLTELGTSQNPPCDGDVGGGGGGGVAAATPAPSCREMVWRVRADWGRFQSRGLQQRLPVQRGDAPKVASLGGLSTGAQQNPSA